MQPNVIEHVPLVHVPPGQVIPQPPQLSTLFAVSTHAFDAKQYVRYGEVVHESMHEVPLQATAPFTGLEHTVHDGPHALASLFTQVEPHRCCPPTHWQTLLTHCSPPEQAYAAPQPPQLLLSVAVSTQVFVASQYVTYGEVVHESTHEVPLHATAPFVGLAHTVHDGPQALASLFTQVEPHRCCPPTHWQTLETHCSPPAQAYCAPQPPQLAELLVVSTHAPLQSVGVGAMQPLTQL